MDLYGLSQHRSEGNARTLANQEFNEQVLTAKDNIENSLDREKIEAQGKERQAKQDESQDKMLYEFHDAVATAGLGQAASRFNESIKAYNKVRAATGRGATGAFFQSQRELAVQRNPKLKGIYGEATVLGDKPSEATTNKADATKETDSKDGAVAEKEASLEEDGKVSTKVTGEIEEAGKVSTSDFASARSALVNRLRAGPGTGDRVPTTPAEEAFRGGGPEASQQQFNDARQALAQRTGRTATPGQGTETVSSNTNTGDESSTSSSKPASEIEEATTTVESEGSKIGTATKKVGQVSEELESKAGALKGALKGAGSVAGLGMKAFGAIGGGISAYDLATQGLAKNKDGSYDVAKDVSEISGVIGTGLDIVGTFIPVLEPLGALATGVSAIADTIDEHKSDTDKVSDAQQQVDDVDKRKQDQEAALPKMKPTAPVNEIVGGGLIATGTQHIQNATQGSGAF